MVKLLILLQVQKILTFYTFLLSYNFIFLLFFLTF